MLKPKLYLTKKNRDGRSGGESSGPRFFSVSLCVRREMNEQKALATAGPRCTLPGLVWCNSGVGCVCGYKLKGMRAWAHGCLVPNQVITKKPTNQMTPNQPTGRSIPSIRRRTRHQTPNSSLLRLQINSLTILHLLGSTKNSLFIYS